MRKAILAILPLLCACEGEAEKAVRRDMLDPDATQFRDVKRCTADGDVWTGEVNGKNRMGAYVGFNPFFYADHSVTYLESYNVESVMKRCFGDMMPSETATPPPPVATAKPKAKAPVAKPAAEHDTPDANFDSEDEAPDTPKLAAKDQCWMDYCPCDTSDPDYGYADIPICRNLRAGLHVEAGLMSAGAAARDARRSIREHEAKFGKFGSDSN